MLYNDHVNLEFVCDTELEDLEGIWMEQEINKRCEDILNQ